MPRAARKVITRSLEERVVELQAELEAALMELALSQREECRRGGPQVEGHAPPPLKDFRDRIDGRGYGFCKCASYLAVSK
jgi:hypothetical protein